MLQQILKDLYVDPEILIELDDQQKQTLFCKMREEQVRRWKIWDEEINKNHPQKTNKDNKNPCKKKQVNFLIGIDGEPWVWVMGEHENDKTIEEILRDEALDKARKIAEKEAEELRKQVEANIELELIDLTPKIEDNVDIYCSVDELREKMKKPAKNACNNYSINRYQNKNNKINLMDRDVLQEITLNKNKVAQRVALWEKRMTEERTCEILKKMEKKQMEAVREAEEAEKKHEALWREQERKAKQAEQQIREIARRAREEHRLSSSNSNNLELDTNCYITPGVPPNRHAVIDWYKTKEIPRNAGLDSSNKPLNWFHGLITRKEAESLLLNQPDGAFLVRLSEKIWGYAISYKAKEKCKHYLVNANQNYSFLGTNQIEHKSLIDLINHHYEYALTGGEKLRNPCPKCNNEGFKEIF
ncbi:SH2 domain-containing protein 4A-like [Onthophagus taurus]|uniref:SH2 domain-containing protein 4A-like n=1 Tax=Onthophagus taurus TaxID=166361 RepID=UPI000C209F8E|nr:SH2 domain-containing protein 4A-like [Onthophagus taurus]